MNAETFDCADEIEEFWSEYLWIPGRTEGRTTDHVEMATFARYVLLHISDPFWSYPVEMTHQDRPDFLIESSRGRVGVEITEQWSKSFGHALALLEKSPGLMEPSDFSFDGGDKKRKGKDVAKLVRKKKLTGQPVMGSGDDRRWVSRTVKTTEMKARKAAEYPNVDELDEIHLCIFDVRPEFPRFDELTDESFAELFASEESSMFSVVACIDTHIVHIDLRKREFFVVFDPHSRNDSKAL